jgi:hypothetical protein
LTPAAKKIFDEKQREANQKKEISRYNLRGTETAKT